MWKDWADHKQTYQELATNHAREKHWVQRTLDRYQPNFTPDITPQPTCIAMDSSGFGDFGLMVCCSPELKKNLYAKVIRSETIEEYRVGLKYLLDRGWKIKAIISDGKGLRQDFYGIPVQMCHFHQQKITTKYLTKNPILEPNIELGVLALKLTTTDKESFTGWLDEWRERHEKFLKEKKLQSRNRKKMLQA